MKPTLRLVILVSGRGSNFRAISDAINRGELDAEIVAVFSDKKLAPALDIARERNIPAIAINPKDYADRLAFDRVFFAEIAKFDPDLIVCAGYMRIMSGEVVREFSDRMINIHPSLLPKFKGLHTHRLAIEAGEKEHGASVHIVTEDLDGGPVLMQARVPVLPDDTEDTLAERVLQVEHHLLVTCLNEWQKGHLNFDGHKLTYRDSLLKSPLDLSEFE